MVQIFDLKVNTIGDLYSVSNKLPAFRLPSVTFGTVKEVLPDAFTDSCCADALCGFYSDADDCGNPVYGCLQYV